MIYDPVLMIYYEKCDQRLHMTMHFLVLFLIIDTKVELRWKEWRKSNLENEFQLQNHTPQVNKNIRGQRTEFLVFAIHQGDQIKVKDSG
jgi:hypothetical protein